MELSLTEPVAPAGPVAPERPPTPSSAFVGRQPILDRNEQLVGYELLYRESESATAATFQDGSQASIDVIASLAQDLGAEQLLGGKVGYVNVDGASLLRGAPVELLDPARTVLEIALPPEHDEGLMSRIADLRAKGYGVALTVNSPTALRHPAFMLATHAKVDLMQSPMTQLPLVMQCLKRVGGRRLLVAEKIETRQQALACLGLGFDLLQGFYFARPETLTARRFDPARWAVVQAIKLLLRNADIVEIDNALKRDVALSLKLLRYMNSAGLGLSTKIESLKHAIALLGYNRLARWLTVLLASIAGRSAVDMVLARTAITRGRLLEVFGEGRFNLAERDNLFIVGTFSLLPAMAMMSMDDALRDLDLPAPIVEALLYRTGPYAPYLTLAEACEDPFLKGVDELCAQLNISPKAVTLGQLQAAHWVSQLGL